MTDNFELYKAFISEKFVNTILPEDDSYFVIELMRRVVMWENDEECGIISMDRTDFPEVTFENSPQEVELKLVVEK